LSSSGHIYWSAFDWQAFATLATGLAAVAGAVWIGLKQTEISANTRNLQQENATADLKFREQNFRLDLFERRADILSKFRPIYFSWQRSWTLNHDEWVQLYRISLDAKLLYPDTISDPLDEAVTEIQRQNQNIDRLAGGEKIYAKQQLREAEDRLFKILPGLLAKMIAHTRIFDGEEPS
jgi:hypothetical protein